MIISEKSDEAATFIGFSAFHTFGIVPGSITPPSLQCSMLPGVNPMLPIATVSYTHLDVYKRQAQNYATLVPGKKSERTVFTMAKFTIPDDKCLVVELNEKNGCLLYTSRCV